MIHDRKIKHFSKKNIAIKNNIGTLYLLFENQDGESVTVDLLNDKGIIHANVKSRIDLRSSFKNILTQVYNELK